MSQRLFIQIYELGSLLFGVLSLSEHASSHILWLSCSCCCVCCFVHRFLLPMLPLSLECLFLGTLQNHCMRILSFIAFGCHEQAATIATYVCMCVCTWMHTYVARKTSNTKRWTLKLNCIGNCMVNESIFKLLKLLFMRLVVIQPWRWVGSPNRVFVVLRQTVVVPITSVPPTLWTKTGNNERELWA